MCRVEDDDRLVWGQADEPGPAPCPVCCFGPLHSYRRDERGVLFFHPHRRFPCRLAPRALVVV